MAFSSPGVFVEEVPSGIASIAGASTSTAGFVGVFGDTINLLARNPAGTPATQVVSFNVPTPANVAVLVTNFTEFANAFGGFTGPDTGTAAGAGTTPDTAHRNLAQAVFGFFANGGSRCYVVRAKTVGEVEAAIDALDAIDEVAIVAAPGHSTDDVRGKLISHCEALKDRFAILDGPAHTDNLDNLKTPGSEAGGLQPAVTNYAAWYYPWLNVFDPAEKLANPSGDGTVQAPPSGHIAGIYARVDTQRGVFKSPANEVVRGALSLTHPLSRAKQDGLNPAGVNLIRDINGAITVWGARTVGGNANGDLKYISTRRTLSFIRESLDEGLQWSVFEPNTPILWAKIRRNVEAFLTTLWRAGGLFGATPQDAFFVKCDAENNQPQDREQGMVNTDVGVAIVRPAEFVIFRISQQQPAK
jgi:Bacteriophage tail sheath protein